MKLFNPACITLVATAVVLPLFSSAHAQSVPSSSRCISGCSSPPVQQSAPPPPSPEAIAQQQRDAAERQRKAAAHEQNEQGNVFFHAGDYDRAVQYYAAALANNPDSTVIRDNLAGARAAQALDFYNRGDYANAVIYYQYAVNTNPNDAQLRQDLQISQNKLQSVQAEAQARAQAQEKQRQAEEKQERDNKDASDSMRQIVQGLTQSLPASAPAGGDLSFGDPSVVDLRDAPNSGKSVGGRSSGPAVATSTGTKSAALDFGDPAAEKNGGLTFGIPGNPSHPDIGAAQPPPAVPVQNVAGQLSSAAKSGVDASKQSAPAAKALAACSFDSAGCVKPDSISFPKMGGQTPGIAELEKHIPSGPARDDPEIQRSMAFYAKLDSEKIDTQTKLAAIQRKLDSHTGDDKVLNAQKGTLTNDLRRTEADQANTQEQIKNRLIAIKVPWNEAKTAADQGNTKAQNKSPQPATGAAADQ